jgi:hypothetical protein
MDVVLCSDQYIDICKHLYNLLILKYDLIINSLGWFCWFLNSNTGTIYFLFVSKWRESFQHPNTLLLGYTLSKSFTF